MIPEAESIARTLAYHERTKHHLQRYARSLGYLDWETQPEPFRTFAGAVRTRLPLAADCRDTPAAALWRAGAVPAEPVTLESLGVFLELALGLSAWKEYQGARWALRNNPSSGNLHPTEGYLVTASRAGVPAGVHHYISRDHDLELRGAPDPEGERLLAELLGPDSILLGLSSVHWREAWKYGERAWRYCRHDAGHALGAARFAAAVLGWRVRRVEAVSDADLAALLGLNAGVEGEIPPPDPEFPEFLLHVSARPSQWPPAEIPRSELVRLAPRLACVGLAVPPSTATVEWEVIDEVTRATAFPGGTLEGAARASVDGLNAPAPDPSDDGAPAAAAGVPAVTLIRGRRSAVRMDGVTGMERGEFRLLLERLIPKDEASPWDAWPWPARVHPVLFVHRVTDLEAGLYFLERRPGVAADLRVASTAGFEWALEEAMSHGGGLWRLRVGNFRATAQTLSCHQEIAADGAFSLGMLAEFGATIRNRGAWWYPRLFHEAGLLGQALYLASEAAGLQATGIGCYFDDAMHELLGLEGDLFQSLYHFTVGRATLDPRLITLPPYASRGA